MRFGPGGLSCSFLLFALIAVFRTIARPGPMVAQSAQENVLGLQLLLLAVYVPLLVLTSVVADQRGKEQALRDSEARYRGVVEDQTELICRFLPDGTYTFVNGAYCRYFQRLPQELLGRTFWPFLRPEKHEEVRELLAAITPQNPVATMEHEVIMPSGEIRWQQWRDRGFFDSQGHITDYQAVGRDITERKQAEEAMQNLVHAARLTMVGELAASIVHEINQPLGAILSNAEAAQILLQSESPPLSEVRNILADIRSDDLRASDVIGRVRTLLHKGKLDLQRLDINAVAQEVLNLVSTEARHHRVVLQTELQSGLPEIRGDRVQLQQVLLNLVVNGLQAMFDIPERERRILMRTERIENQGVKVSVIDAGPGLSAVELSKVFDSFFTTKKHGMGLGLAIARSIVEAHDGRIWADNNVGPGATFCFTLPAAAPEIQATEHTVRFVSER
jgi:PAS domain S-box-containing protein